MKKHVLNSALFWITVTLLLVALFNFWPKLAAFPTALVLFPALAILTLTIYSTKRERWNEKVYGQITVRHLLASAVVLLCVPFLWMLFVVRFVRNNPEQLWVIVIIPAVVMILLGGISFGIAMYFANPNRNDV
jgi:hypothetical protein